MKMRQWRGMQQEAEGKGTREKAGRQERERRDGEMSGEMTEDERLLAARSRPLQPPR